MVSLERVRDELRSMFWVVPAACVVIAIGVANRVSAEPARSAAPAAAGS